MKNINTAAQNHEMTEAELDGVSGGAIQIAFSTGGLVAGAAIVMGAFVAGAAYATNADIDGDGKGTRDEGFSGEASGVYDNLTK